MASKHFNKKILALGLLTVLVACAPTTPSGKGISEQAVIDGDAISVADRKNNLPSVSVVKVMHWRDDGAQGSCTGVLISKRFVLTAGHCLDGSGGTKVLRVAFQFTPENVKLVQVVRYQVHEVYQATQSKSDLALLLLATDAPRGYAPAALNAPSFWERLNAKPDGYVEYYGYGCGSRPYTPGSDCDHGILRKGFTKQAVFFNDMISWKKGNGDVCGGDSGGPAFIYRDGRFYVAGIASHIGDPLDQSLRAELNAYYHGNKWDFYAAHPELNECMGQANYTDVSRHIDWIKDTQEMLSEYIK